MINMRTAFQLLVFAAYVAALVWGGWHVFSNYVLPERDATSDVEEVATPELLPENKSRYRPAYLP